VIHDVGVRHAGPQVAGAVFAVERKVLDEAVGAHPSVAVPLRPPVLDAHAVDHAVAGEPVAAGLPRVRPVAEVPPVEVGGDGAHDGQVELGQFGVDGGVVAHSEELAGSREIVGDRGLDAVVRVGHVGS
jgi:hypothetical protein